MNKIIFYLLLQVVVLGFQDSSSAQAPSIGGNFWPYVEPPNGVNLEIDVAHRILYLHAPENSDPYVITYHDDKTGKEEKYFAWAREIIWDDENQRAKASGNVRIKNDTYFVHTEEVIYDRVQGTVTCPGVTKVVQTHPNGFTDFIRAKRVDIRLYDQGVESLKFDSVLESRIHISKMESDQLMRSRDLATPDQQTESTAPIQSIEPVSPFVPQLPRRDSGPEL